MLYIIPIILLILTTYYYGKYDINKIDLAKVKTVKNVRYFLTMATIFSIISTTMTYRM
ncbi:TPA: hypothetical protein LA742_002877 [Clostridium botulinum]|uniref:hypothetical protein n=1 Tax=Clostridium sporogenes TaxID=1509 RepID=UPI000A4675DC|nr:hypothetical protein [Clostridium sporogenes]HBJ2614385.1 hypothetical protein [Clostridium botulinum]